MPGNGTGMRNSLKFPTDVIVEKEGDENGVGDVLLVSDSNNHRILRLTCKGAGEVPDVEVRPPPRRERVYETIRREVPADDRAATCRSPAANDGESAARGVIPRGDVRECG